MARQGGALDGAPRADAWLHSTLERSVAYDTSEQPSRLWLSPEEKEEKEDDESEQLANDWHFSGGPSPIPNLQEVEEASGDFAQSHFRRRNRLETRLEELQKDVASLTLKLRANSNRSTSSIGGHVSFDRSVLLADTPSKPATPSGRSESHSSAAKGKAKPRASATAAPKHATTSGRLVGSQPGTVRTLRELHTVTTERDQLKFELEKTKRALTVAEKKCEDARRSEKAYKKLKAHCESLQESLDLSEKIRVRQKKLLQQMQMQQQQRKDKDSARSRAKAPENPRQIPAKKRPASAGSRLADQRGLGRTAATKQRETQPVRAVRAQQHTDFDILDSLVSSFHHTEEPGLATHEQAPSEPTAAARSRLSPKRRSRPITPATNPYRTDFDTLLQNSQPEPPRFGTQRPSRIETKEKRRPSQTQLQQQKAMQQAAKWARARGVPMDMSTSTTRKTRRSPTNRPKNSFLAPTQASLRRLHDLRGRDDGGRPPFVV
ncbi:hypothetical protein BBJ28_00020409 [Nothophytophthora sp. Chile5]|nr:hypothetical protein BBJ28_00020409 [Nothophytophthora sp. Chile5]